MGVPETRHVHAQLMRPSRLGPEGEVRIAFALRVLPGDENPIVGDRGPAALGDGGETLAVPPVASEPIGDAAGKGRRNAAQDGAVFFPRSPRLELLGQEDLGIEVLRGDDRARGVLVEAMDDAAPCGRSALAPPRGPIAERDEEDGVGERASPVAGSGVGRPCLGPYRSRARARPRKGWRARAPPDRASPKAPPSRGLRAGPPPSGSGKA